MKALTISQPHASKIASGEKWVENRSWATKYRGPLAIHAGKGTQYLTAKELRESGLPFGAVIAVAELVECFYLRDVGELHAACGELPLTENLTSLDLLQHEHTTGPHCLILANVRPITPVPWKGAQGLWELPDDFQSREGAR